MSEENLNRLSAVISLA